MSPVAQWSAVRAAHALPPSPRKDRLLAAGYANLGLLTGHHWSADPKVYLARGIVYAERAAERAPGPEAQEVRAYAAALAGWHAAAPKHAESAGPEPSARPTQ